MNIQREFLYNENKVVPLQLMKTSYGIVTNTSMSDEEDLSRTIEVRFPSGSSNIALMMENDKIVEIVSTPPGKYSVDITVVDGHIYNLYIISREYLDGFVKADNTVSPIEDGGVKLDITYSLTIQQIDLTTDSMELSSGRSDDNPAEWYNYQGVYEGGLLWESPLDSLPEISGENVYLIYYMTILRDMLQIFSSAGVDIFDKSIWPRLSNKHVKMWLAHDNLVKYVNKIESNENLMDVPQIADLISYVKSSNIINEDYVTNTFESHDIIESKRTLYLYGGMESNSWGISALYAYGNLDEIGGSGHRQPWDDWYRDVRNRVRNDEYLNEYTLNYDDSIKIYENSIRATELKDFYSNNQAWSRGPGGGDQDGPIARRETASKLAINVRDLNTNVEAKLDSIGLGNLADSDEVTDRIHDFSQSLRTNFGDFIVEEISTTEDLIDQVGDLIFITGSSITGETEFPLAHEATLQNIRFLKNLIMSVDENVWTSLNNGNALILSSVLDLTAKIESSPIPTTILNITNSTVKSADIEVLYKSITGATWIPIETSVSEAGEDVKLVNLNVSGLQLVGKYVVLVRPTRIRENVTEITSDGLIIIEDSLNLYQTDQYFYGYNAQTYTPNEYTQGEQKVVVESKWSANKQYIKLSPTFEGAVEINPDLKIDMWPNTFMPIMIEVDIVEHNSLTLSYNMYAKKEMNTNSGLCTIYDYNGNVYKELSFGKVSNPGTGGDIIEYRAPADETDDY